MPNQVLYQTNADWYATWKNLTQNPIVVAAVDRTEKGLLWFRLKGTNTVFILSPEGRLQVRWSSPEEKKVAFEIVKHLLVPEEKQKLKVTPLKQQLWIDYPEPENFRIYWCKEETEYLKKEHKVLVTEEPIPIWLALWIKQKYPDVEIRTREKSIWEKIRDFLFEPSIPVPF